MMRSVFLGEPSTEGRGELNHIFKSGVELSDRLTLVDSMTDADVLLLDALRTHRLQAEALVSQAKDCGCEVVAVDYSDDPQSIRLLEVRGIDRFLKRSMVLRERGASSGLIHYTVACAHIAYCVREDILAYVSNASFPARHLDIACFHSTELLERHGQTKRGLIAQTLSQQLPKSYSREIGHVGFKGRRGRNEVNPDYVDTLLRSLIVVNCQPDRWEGDYRLFEALACGPLVMCDRMLRPPQGLQDGKHLIFYDDPGDLLEKACYYLENEEERLKIANQGQQAAINEHRSRHRMEQACL
ncbi:glycosyltransferase [Luminiphilus sp.]|nr:glycosyltransferase [Luminiphilus sp.]